MKVDRPLYLSQPDAEAVVRMLDDVATLDGDHRVKRRFLVSELAKLLDAIGWVWILGQKSTDPSAKAIPFLMIDGGWESEHQRSCYIQWHAHPQYTTLIVDRINPYWQQHFSRIRQEIVPDEQWYGSSLYRQWYVKAGLDHFLATSYPVGLDEEGQLTTSGLMFHRATGAKPFGDRERFLLHLVASEVRWLHHAGTDVPAKNRVADLPPRQYEVMLMLLAGDSASQIGDKLGVSVHTVREHMKQLYQRFGVQSDGEFVAQFISGDASDCVLREDQSE